MHEADMQRFTLFAAIAALILAGVATSDAAPRKKPQVRSDRSAVVAVKHKRQVARPHAVPLNQQWPTSWSDGSFRYGD
jgi:hypothetical protein